MGVLTRAAIGVALAAMGCYEPELTDCQVSCSAELACAGDQVCDDGWCVAPAAVGTCDQRISSSSVRVEIKGRGRVELEPLGEACESTTNMGDACTYEVAATSSLTLLAVETEWRFDKWESDNCRDEDEDCELEIDDDTHVVAKFKD